jgi:CheY-like chemotaxis protein
MDGTTAPLAGRRILVVDDQRSIRGVLQVALAQAGAEVTTADDGASALRLVQTSPPELILLDLIMPEMDGWGVIRALSASPATAGIPVVLETSAEDFASFDRAKREGVAAFVAKPFRLGEVIETCRRVLAGARPLQAADPADPGQDQVQICGADGTPLATGVLVELGAHGAQVACEMAFDLGQRVRLLFGGGAGPVAYTGEVRWVSRMGQRYHLGLALEKG